MKFMNQERFMARTYREEAGADGGEGGGGEGEGEGSGEGEGEGQGNELQAQLQAIQEENARLQAKVNEANKHKKEAERLAKQKEREEAEAKGNYEQLFKSSESEREALQQQLEEIRQESASKEVNNLALKAASELAEGPNAEILADYIARRLKFTDDGVKVTDNDGNLTVSTLDDLKREFKGSARFASLIKGRQSSGGGASGGTNDSGSTAETMSRADFDALNPAAKMSFIKKGGKVKQP